MPPTSCIARFRARISTTPDGCWLWTGRLRVGHPILEDAGKRVQVRRWAWEQFKTTPVPRYVQTTCRQRLCVCPDHLIEGSTARRWEPEAPDNVVRFMLENPRGHREACKLFDVTEAQLIEILDEYYRG